MYIIKITKASLIVFLIPTREGNTVLTTVTLTIKNALKAGRKWRTRVHSSRHLCIMSRLLAQNLNDGIFIIIHSLHGYSWVGHMTPQPAGCDGWWDGRSWQMAGWCFFGRAVSLVRQSASRSCQCSLMETQNCENVANSLKNDWLSLNQISVMHAAWRDDPNIIFSPDFDIVFIDISGNQRKVESNDKVESRLNQSVTHLSIDQFFSRFNLILAMRVTVSWLSGFLTIRVKHIGPNLYIKS